MELVQDVVRWSAMKRNGVLKLLVLILAMALVVAACDSDGEAELTTTSSVVGATTAPDVESTGGDDGGTTTTSLVGESVASHEVISRESTDDGEVLYIVVPEGSYTDVDLENFVGNLIENDDSIEDLEIFDDEEAVTAYLLDESDRTASDLALIDEHHLVSLQDRNQIIFRGPYAEFGETAIGS